MAYDLEEQEQIEGIKAFWKSYGNFILTAVTVVLLAIAGVRGWYWYQDRKASEAAEVFERVRAAAVKPDLPTLQDAAGTLFEKFGGTVYAPMAALLVARAHVEAGDSKAARPPLQWTIEHAADESFVHVARIRLAGLLIDDKAYDEASKLLSVDAPARYAGMYADRRGDLMLAQDKKAEARDAWKQALERLEANAPLRRLVQLKLDGIGGAGS